MPAVERFEFAFAPAYRALSRGFGVKPSNAWVDVGDGRIVARFGPWRVFTPFSNITDVEITGPYRMFKTAGPARLGFTDRGLTFATNGDRGVLITFATPIRGMDRFGLLKHPELTVTVAEIERFADVLRRAIG